MADITFSGGTMDGEVSPPPSKSHTHRAIILAALSQGRCRISSPLVSFDTRATMDAVRSMGATVTEGDGYVDVESRGIHAPDGTIDVGNSGTTLRLMTGIAATFGGETVLTGDGSIRKRPMGPLLDALSACGVVCTSDGGRPPVSVRGPVTGDRFVIDGSVSSQFISSLIMASPLIGRRMAVEVTGREVSKPYIDISLAIMRRFGAAVEEDGTTYRVGPGGYRPADYRVPADFSSAAFPLVAGALGGRVTVRGMDMEDAQGDSRIVDVLRSVGCGIFAEGDRITCTRPAELRAADIDVGDVPDLFPVIAVLLSTAKGRSRLYGAPHLRFKESDRIALTERMLRTLGADIEATPDGCIIEGVPHLKGGRIEHGGDHRMFMAAAVASLVSDGPVSMENDACWNVSYPRFPEQMRSAGMRVCGPGSLQGISERIYQDLGVAAGHKR